MTPEPNQRRGPESRQAESYPDAARPDLPSCGDGQPRPLLDGLPPSWELPDAIARAHRAPASATRATHLARARQFESKGDRAAAAAEYREFARICWAKGFDYGAALRAARHGLELEVDDAFRLELVGHLENLGEHLASAQLLEEMAGGLDSALIPSIRQRLASLCCRAGDAAGAAVHFSELARLDAHATDALSALGTMAGWAPEQVSRERGVVAWHEAARRFKAQGAQLAAFEATHRAFELEPASSLAAERLAQELETLGRREAADEVWRQSAVAAGDSARHDVRAIAALDAGDIIGALAALLDGRADCSFEVPELLGGVEHLLSPNRGISCGFDMVLAELGCADWLAVRLEVGSLLERWTEEANCHVALSRLEASYFVHLDSAREALVRAIVVHPAHPEARARLANWANAGDCVDPLLRALVQSARAAQGGLLARQLAGEILERGRTEPSLASLQLWAFERLQATGHLSEELRSHQPKWAELVEQQRAEWVQIQSSWSDASTEGHAAAVRALENRLALEPGRTIDHLAIVVTLVELEPTNAFAQSLYVELLDVAARLVISPSREDRLARALAQAPHLLGERGRIAQAKFHLRHGQVEPALSALLHLLDEPNASIRGLLWLFTLARRFRDSFAAARALERISIAFRPAIRGVLEALVAELYLDARASDDALRIVSSASRTSQNLPRLVTLEIRLAECSDTLVDTESTERALSKVLPNAHLCRVLASAHLHDAEPDVALAWIHRAVSLRPGDVALRIQQLELALEVGSVSRVVDVLDGLMSQALPISAWIESAASALAWLTAVDPTCAMATARRLLDFVGAAARSLRAALLDAAHVNEAEGFAVEVLERASAVALENAAIHVALAERCWKSGAREAAISAALRAARAGATVDALSDYVENEGQGESSDAQLDRLELQRLLLAHGTRRAALQEALSAVAVARFELAQDLDGAVAVWRELAQLGDIAVWGRVAREMGDLLGNLPAARRLVELSASMDVDAERAKVLGLAAQLCSEANEVDEALRIIELALSSSPVGTGLLPLAERISSEAKLLERLESVYATVEQSILGGFAERSLHLRAARAFEISQHWSFALRHALLAFEALPEDFATWNVLVRTSRGAAQPQTLAQAAMRVAEAFKDREMAHRWLARAYDQMGDSEDELRLRFDLAIRMLVGVPQVSNVHRVAQCIRQMRSARVEEVDFMRMRFERALESLAGELEGPDGARLGIAMSEVAAVELGRFDIAAHALMSAIKADADLEEFAGLASALVPRIADAAASLLPMLLRVSEWLDRPYVQIGREAIRLLISLAVAAGNVPTTIRTLLAGRRHGHEEWLVQWVLDEFLPSLFESAQGRRRTILFAEACRESGANHLALNALDRAAEFSSLERSESSDPVALDATWQLFREQYELSIERVSVPAGIAELRQRLGKLERFVPAAILSTLRVKIERGSGDGRALCAALAELAFVGTGSPGSRAELLIEAAGLAQTFGDNESALVYYRAAVGTSRTSVAARLGLSTLLVRMGRHRTPEQAQLLLEMTTGLEVSLSEEQRDMAVFLQAEALEILGKADAAHRLLEEAEATIGPRPLVVLGLAEHSVRLGRPALALGYYAAALGGNLRDMRSPSQVSIQAARAAAAVGDVTMALQWLGAALDDTSTRPDALVLEAELQGAAEVMASAPDDSIGAPDDSIGAPDDSIGAPDEPSPATPTLSSAGFEFARSDERTEPAGILERLGGDGASRVAGPGESGSAFGDDRSTTSDAGSRDDETWRQRMTTASTGDEPERSSGDVAEGIEARAEPLSRSAAEEPSEAKPAPVESDGVVGPPEPVEPAPLESQGPAPTGSAGSVAVPVEPTALEMAILVAEQAATEPERLRAWIADGKRQLRQWPLCVELADLLRRAAQLEQHGTLATALAHVVGVLRGDVTIPESEDLSGQVVDVDAVRAILMRELATPELEALALVWDGAEHEFLREASDYEITGVMRVVGAASVLARSYSEIARHFGLSRTPLFFKRSNRTLDMRVLLLNPTAVMLEGEVGVDDPTIAYTVGCALWATMPEYSLLFGSSRDRAASVLRALVLAFGSTVGQPNPTQGESLRLAQVLWQTVKSRSQRRLKEICNIELDVERGLAAARQSLRRAGLYASGDLRVSLAAVSAELGMGSELVRERRWQEVARLAPEILDLFRFASSAEYADVRWQPGRPPHLGGRGA